MHLARRDLVLQTAVRHGRDHGDVCFAYTRAADPIASSIVELVAINGTTLRVRGLDCLDGTPLVDLKPEHIAASD